MGVGPRQYFGGGQFRESGTDIAIVPGLARGWVVKATAGNVHATLPDATKHEPGLTLSILNEGAHPIGLADHEGTVLLPPSGLGSIGAGFAAHVVLVGNATPGGDWRPRIGQIGAAVASVPWRNLWVVGGTGTPRAAVYFDGAAWISATGPAQDHVDACFLPLGTPFGGRALLVGDGDAGTAMHAYADELDEAGTWRVATDAPYVVGRAQGAGVDGVGYLFGGDGLFDVAAYTRPAWVAKNGLGAAISRGGAARFGDRILLVPGDVAGAPFGSTVPRVYWPAADSYYDAPAPAARRQFFCWAAEGRVYAAGGYVPSGSPAQLATVEAFDGVAETWATKTVMSTGARYSGAAAGGLGGGFVAGGKDNTDTARTEAARYSDDGWAALGPVLPGAMSECAGALL